jgi:hypothetical protein
MCPNIKEGDWRIPKNSNLISFVFASSSSFLACRTSETSWRCTEGDMIFEKVRDFCYEGSCNEDQKFQPPGRVEKCSKSGWHFASWLIPLRVGRRRD